MAPRLSCINLQRGLLLPGFRRVGRPSRRWIVSGLLCWRDFPGFEPNSSHGGHSRLSCSAVDAELGAGFCRDLQQTFCTDVGHHAASPRRHKLAAIAPDPKMINAANPAIALLSLRWTLLAKRACVVTTDSEPDRLAPLTPPAPMGLRGDWVVGGALLRQPSGALLRRCS